MPRSERCRVRGNCLDGIALPSRGQAPAAGGPPGAGRAAPTAHRAGASRRRGLSPSRRPLGLGERSKAVSDSLRTWRGHGRGGQAIERQGRSWKTIGPGPAARLLGAGRPARAEPRRRGLMQGRRKKPNSLLGRLWADSGPCAKCRHSEISGEASPVAAGFRSTTGRIGAQSRA
jgi:hypothetical protein